MARYTIIDAPSNLGLRPTGVETLPIAVKAAGLVETLGASYGGRVPPLPYSHERDPSTYLRNGESIRIYSAYLADVVAPLVSDGRFPIVLGGDCSVLLGAMLGLRRIGRYGLLFLDGHADFYQPEADLNGEVASMDLALVSGRGPDLLANMEGFRPLVRDQDIVVFGFRDGDGAAQEGSQDIRATLIRCYDLTQTRTPDVQTAAAEALRHVARDDLAGFWLHLDVDVIDDGQMSAVDYRLSGGLSFDDITMILRMAIASGRAVGMTLTIFNPLLDADGSIVRQLVTHLTNGLAEAPLTARP